MITKFIKKHKNELKDIGLRALKTFIQTFLGMLTVVQFDDTSNIAKTLLAITVSSCSAAFSILWNSLEKMLGDEENE